MQRYTHPTQIPRSRTIRCIDWLSDLIRIKNPNILGDSHPMTWAADDAIYIGTGDPLYYVKDGVPTRAVVDVPSPPDRSSEAWDLYCRTTGTVFERITGDPEDMQLARINDLTYFNGYGGSGVKPTGMLSVNGTLFFAVQNLLGCKAPHFGSHCQHGSDATIISSRDYGRTWTPDLTPVLDAFSREQFIGGTATSPYYGNRCAEWKAPSYERTSFRGWVPMFPGDRFGTPSFVQFGKDNCDAVDEYVYAISSDQFDNGTNLRVGRVHRDHILEADQWEFARYEENGSVGWTKDLDLSDPMLEVYRHIGAAEMVYIPAFGKYITLTSAFHADFDTRDGSELTVLESDHPWGPFSLVYYEWMWYRMEACGYCPRLPLKWFDPKTLTGYMEWSGDWSNVDKGYYAPSVRKFRIVTE